MRLGAGHIAAFALSIGLFACGFHLRGEAHYSFATLFLNPTPALPLTTELKRSLEGVGSAKLVASVAGAEAILEVNSVETATDPVLVGWRQGGRIPSDQTGPVPPTTTTARIGYRPPVLVRRSYTYSDTEALAKEAQEQRLWREMQTDSVQQIVRRLQAAKKPTA
jgi:LPS-assembly lipoprotein